MWPVILITGGVVLLSLVELPGLWRRKEKKELWIFSVLMLLGFGLGIAQALRLKIPNPYDWIVFVYEPISEWIFNWLKSGAST